MTHIVNGARTKKQLKEKLTASPAEVYFDDPSIFPGAWSGRADQMEAGQSLTCTNHPKRSWFARITRKSDQSFKVE